MSILVLLRHGNSAWNLVGRFTGWTDIPLNGEGMRQAEDAGKKIASRGIVFGEAHCSVLRRTLQTADALLQAAHQAIPVHSSWRLNERHYGRLQGMRKTEIFSEWGESLRLPGAPPSLLVR